MSKRERNLLFFALATVVGVLYYFFAYQPIGNQIDLLKNEITTLDGEVNILTLENIKRDDYEENIKKAKTVIDIAENALPAGITQEMIIKILGDMQDKVPDLEIPSFTMGLIESFATTQVVATVENEEGEIPNPNITETAIRVPVALNLEMPYEDFKKLLRFTRDYPQTLSVSNIQAASNLEADTVTTSFTLFLYGLESPERPFIPEDYFGPFEGEKESIFGPFEDYGQVFETGGSDNTDILFEEEEDFILFIAPEQADTTTIVMGKLWDDDVNTYVYADNPEVEPVRFEFKQEGDQYLCRYSTSEEAYPESAGNFVPFNPGENIEIKVYSRSRIDLEDQAGAGATIINQTDLPVYVTFFSEDQDNPRFNLSKAEGDVQVIDN